MNWVTGNPRFALQSIGEDAQLRDLLRADAEGLLRVEIDRAGVPAVQLVELRRDLLPDARFFGGVFDERRAELREPMLSAECEQLVATLHVPGIAKTGVPGLELQRVRVGRLDDRLRIDRLAVLEDRGAVVHCTTVSATIATPVAPGNRCAATSAA